MDVLRGITADELEFIKSKLREDFPKYIKDLNYIQSAERCCKASKNFSDTSDRVLAAFYVPRNGKKENCTIFGITPARDRTVWFFTFEESLKEAEECLNTSQLIRWSDGLLFVTIHARFTPIVEDCIRNNGYHLKVINKAAYYWIEKEAAANMSVNIPDGFALRTLQESDAKLCNSLWTYSDDNSELFARSLISINGGFALCDGKTGDLLSFGLVNDHLGVGMLHTIENARGKGYAEVVAKALCKQIAEGFDLHPTSFIEGVNTSSIKLFERIGFKKIGDCDWIYIGPLTL